MKKLTTTIDDNEKPVEIDKDVIRVNSNEIRIIKETNLGIVIEINKEQTLVDDVIDLPEEGLKRIEINGYTIDVKVVDPVMEALDIGPGGSGKIISPMSGTISSIDVEIGQEVEEGSVLLVISAMKMENQITTPVTGVVQDIKVNNNEQVPSGKLLVVVEPKE